MAKKKKSDSDEKSLSEKFAEKKAREEQEKQEKEQVPASELQNSEVPKKEKPKKKFLLSLFKKKKSRSEESTVEEKSSNEDVEEEKKESEKESSDNKPEKEPEKELESKPENKPEKENVSSTPSRKFKFGNLFKKKQSSNIKNSEMRINAAKKSIESDDEVKKTVRKERKSFLHKQKKKQKRERRSTLQKKRILTDLLLKAGFVFNPDKLQKIVFYITLVFIAVFTFLTLIVAAASGKSAGGLLLFYLGLWTAVFAFTYIFIWMIIYFYLDIRIYRRTMELEDVLPDFLQLASANISAGMPIDRALWFAVRPNFGVLAKEIEEVAKSTLAGEELDKSLLKFTERYESVTLKRSISILLEGLEAGGEIAELLNKIALNIQETKIQRKEMSANVATYAIFITFASIIMAPLLFALATELLTIIVKITSSLDMSSSAGSFLTLNINTSAGMVADFKIFCIMMLTISALMSASIVSVIRRGRIKEGLRNLPIFVIVSLVLYFFASSILHSMLGNLI